MVDLANSSVDVGAESKIGTHYQWKSQISISSAEPPIRLLGHILCLVGALQCSSQDLSRRLYVLIRYMGVCSTQRLPTISAVFS